MDVDKILCMDGGNKALETAALMNNGMNGGNWFVWLFFLLFAQRMGWGENSPQLQALQNQMQDNQNSNLLMDAVKGNTGAIQQLATNLNCDFNQLSGSICDIKNAISQVGGQIGFSAEKIINSILMGNSQVIQAIQNCCCNTQQAITKMGYDNQLSICELKNTIHAEGEATRGLIRQNQFDALLAEKTRLQTVLDLRDQQNTFAGMIQASVAPIAQQVQSIAAHQLPTYPQAYIPGTPYVNGATGFWG